MGKKSQGVNNAYNTVLLGLSTHTKPLNMWPRISHAIVMTDALNIHEGILKLKKAVLQRRAA